MPDESPGFVLPVFDSQRHGRFNLVYVMGKIKKKSAPSTKEKAEASTENPPQQPRKRGRPKKIIEEKVEAKEEEEEEEEEAEAAESESKKPKASSKQAGESSGGGVKEEGTSTVSVPAESKAPKALKRKGSRRKSQPRRAAESYIPASSGAAEEEAELMKITFCTGVVQRNRPSERAKCKLELGKQLLPPLLFGRVLKK
eukprot:Gb_09753 [translate_table: standard]